MQRMKTYKYMIAGSQDFKDRDSCFYGQGRSNRLQSSEPTLKFTSFTFVTGVLENLNLQVTRPEARWPEFDFRQGTTFLFVTTGSEVHPAYAMGTGSLYAGKRRPERDANQRYILPRLRMYGSIPQIPHTSAWRGGLNTRYYNICILITYYAFVALFFISTQATSVIHCAVFRAV